MIPSAAMTLRRLTSQTSWNRNRSSRRLWSSVLKAPPNKKNMNDLHFLYQNHWGELFVCQFRTQEELQAFVRNIIARQTATPEIRYYIQRNSHYYEKNIERAKKAVVQAIKAGIVARM